MAPREISASGSPSSSAGASCAASLWRSTPTSRSPDRDVKSGGAAPFITLPAVITKNPVTGVRNVGMYRMQVIDRASTFMHWQIHEDGRADLLAAQEAHPRRRHDRARPEVPADAGLVFLTVILVGDLGRLAHMHRKAS